MLRVVLDTNVLINADKGQFSYPKRILDLVLSGKLEAVITESVARENILLINRLVRDSRLKADLQDFFIRAERVTPARVQAQIEDKEDIKLLSAALGGRAQYLITEDRHLLDLDNFQGVTIVTPEQFWRLWEKGDQRQAWRDWTKNILGN